MFHTARWWSRGLAIVGVLAAIACFSTAPAAYAAAPANDAFVFAETITGLTGQTVGSNVGATTEPGEPGHASSVWYKWVAPTDAIVRINTIGSDFDTVLHVFTGSAVDSLSEVALNDDFNAPSGRQSAVLFEAVAGQTYIVAVKGYGDEQGNIVLTWAIGECTIAGQVTDADGAPIVDVDVNVYVNDGSGNWYWTGYSNTGDDPAQSGKYVFGDLPDGQYKLRFGRTCDTPYGAVRAEEYYNDKRTIAEADVVTVLAGSTFTADVTLEAPVPSVAGRVSDVDGEPIDGAQVRLYQDDGSGGWDNYDYAYTGDDPAQPGKYVFGDLPDGQYKLSFGRSWDTPHGAVWGEEYYNDTRTLPEADVVTVVAGSTFTADAALEAPTLSVAGQVTNADGQPIDDADVYLYQDNGAGDWNYFGYAYSGDDPAQPGKYAFAGLPNGQYKLGFIRTWDTTYGAISGEEYYSDKRTFAEADVVTVAAGSTFIADAMLEAPMPSVAGRVTNVDGEPIDDAWVQLYQQDGSGDWNNFRSVYTGDDPAQSGKYVFGGVPDGSYKLEFQRGWDTTYGATWGFEYYNDKRTFAEADILNVVAGLIITADTTLEAPVPSLAGRVTDDDGEPIDDVDVCLYQENASGDWNDFAYVNTSTESGKYAFEDLPDGQYKLGFGRSWDTTYGAMWGFEYYNHKHTLAEADVVNVVAGSTFTADATLEAPVPSVAGTVTDADGQPIERAYVHLDANDGSGSWGTFTGSGPTESGKYHFVNAPDGQYKLGFQHSWDTTYGVMWGAEYYNDKRTSAEAELLTVVAGSTFAANATLEAPVPSLAGRVTDVEGEPIEDADVYLYQDDGSGGWNYFGATSTGDDPSRPGNYLFGDAPDGQYKIEFGRSWDTTYGAKWGTEYYSDKRTFAEADIVTVAAGAIVTADATLEAPVPSVAGRVTDAEGQPSNEAYVTLYQEDGSGGWQMISTYIYTGDDPAHPGKYAFWDLPDGQYKLGIMRIWFTEYGMVSSYEYYNDKLTLAEAEPFTVGSGSTFTADATLQSEPVPDLAGRVTDAEGQPIGGAEVYLYQQNGSGDWYLSTFVYTGTFNNEPGKYAFWDLPDGQYKLGYGRSWDTSYGAMWGAEYYHDKGTLAEAELLTVVGGSTFTADAILSAPVPAVVGQVTDSEGTQVNDVRIWLYESDGSGGWYATWNGYTGDYGVGPGSFAFWDVPDGEYKVEFTPTDGNLQPEWFDNKATLAEATTVTVTWGQTTDVSAELSVGDIIPPTTTANGPAGWVTDPVSITLSSTDTASGVDRIVYSLDGSDEAVYGDGVYVEGDLIHTLEYAGIDRAGNRETTRTATIRIDGTAPTSSSNANSSYNTTAAISISATDALSGVTKTELNLDDSGWIAAVFLATAAPGHHTLMVRATDAAGNVETPQSFTFDVLPRYEQSNTMLAYAGTWSTATGASYSGGNLKVARGAGTEFTANFTGTAVKWIALVGPGYGIARVTVDGGTPVLVDLYSAAYGTKRTVWSASGLANTSHTLRVEWTGTRAAGATNDYVNLDALDVAGTLTQAAAYTTTMTRYEQTNPMLAYAGAWTTATATSYSGGDLAVARGVGTEFTANFTGTGVKWIALVGAGYGIARVTVDGGTPVLVDLYSAANATKRAVWSASGLANTSHTLRVEWTGTRNAAATNDYVNLDALDVTGTLTQVPTVTTRYEQTTPMLAYAGAWTTATATSYSGGNLAVARGVDTEFTASFTGTGVKWIALVGPGYGIARVTVDGGTPLLVDLYSAAYGTKRTVWSASGLANTSHTLRVEWTGTRNAAATNDYVNLDALDAAGTLTQTAAYTTATTRYEQTNPMLAYAGAWTTATATSYSGGNLKVARGAGTEFTANFTGTGVKWIALVGAGYGIARVTVDGGTPVLVDLYSAANATKRTVWSASGLANSSHTVRVEWTGTRNAAATNDYVNLDALDVTGTLN